MSMVLLNPYRYASAFAPDSLAGLALHVKGSAEVTSNGAAQFTAANSEYLSRADNASLSTGNVDFWVSGWVYLDSKGIDRFFAVKGDASSIAGYEFAVFYQNASDRLRFHISDGTNQAQLAANSLGSPAINTWYFFLCWHDAVNDTVNIKINNGTTDSLAFTTGSHDTANPFYLGQVGNSHNGRMQSVAFGKSPAGGVAGVIGAINTSLWNGGSGKRYDDLTSAEKTDWGLVSFWNLSEPSGTRNDAHGTNHLTDNNTVTAAIGQVTGAARNFEVVATWGDQSANNRDLSQGTATFRPNYRTSMQNSKPGVRWEGGNNRLSLAASLSLGTACTAAVAIKFNAFGGVMLGGGGGDYIFYADSTDVYFSAGGSFVGVAHGLSTGTWAILGVTRSGTTVKFFKNGAQLGTTKTLGANNTQSIQALGSYQDGTLPSQIEVPELTLYTQAHTDANMVELHNYLNNEYAVY